MFNPQAMSNFSSQKQGQQQPQGIGSVVYAGSGTNQYGQHDSQGNSQMYSTNYDQSNVHNKLQNMLQSNQQQQQQNSQRPNQQQVFNDKKVLNQNLQMMLSTNNAQKLNQSHIMNAKNGSQQQPNQLNQTMQTNNVNTTFRKEQMQLELRDEKTFTYCSRWFHIGLVCFYSIAAVVVTSILVYYFPQTSAYRSELGLTIDNWGQEMIEDFELHQLTAQDITNKGSPTCSQNYYNLFTVSGLGTLDGCNCKTSTYSQKVVLQFPCQTEHKQAGCTDVQGISPPVGFNWETPDGVNRFSICAKKITGLTYSANGSQTTCDKQCGGSTDDTKICVALSQSCPINYVYFGLAPEATPIQELKEIKIGIYTLYYSSKGPGAPIVDTRVTKGGSVCLNNQMQNLYPNSVINPLLDLNLTQVCTKTDSRFTKLISLNEKKLYEINYFDNVYTAIPDYTLSSTELYSVYTRPFIALSANKRSDGILNVQDSNSQYDKVYNSSVSVLVTSIFYLVFVGIIYTVSSVLNILSKRYLFKQYLFDINPVNEHTKSSIFKRLWLKLSITFIHLISLLVAFIITMQNYIYLRFLTDGVIGDTYTVALMNNLMNEYKEQIFWFITGNFIYFGSLIVLEMFVLVPLCSKKLKEDTEIKISKRYLPKSETGRSQQQNVPNSNNNRTFELPEYQTHNIYAGNGVNTTINPFVQQMSVLGGDITTVNNRSVHMGPGGYNSQARYTNNPVSAYKQANINNSVINQSILPPEIKENNQYHNNMDNTQYKPPSNQTGLDYYKKTLQLNSITNRVLDNGMNNQQTLPTAQNAIQTDFTKNYSNIYDQNSTNEKVGSINNNNNNINNNINNNSSSNNYRNTSPIPFASKGNTNQFQGEDINYANQTIDLDFQSNQQVIQNGGTSHINDTSNDFGLHSSIGGEFKKNNRQNQNSLKNQFTNDTFPAQGGKINDFGKQIQPIPEVDSYRQQIIGGQDRYSNQRISSNYDNQNYNNQSGKSNIDQYNARQDYQQQPSNPAIESNFVSSSNNNMNNNMNNNKNNMNKNILMMDQDYNIREEANNYSNTMNEHLSEYRVQPIKNTGFNANQKHLQDQYNNKQIGSYNTNSFRDTATRTTNIHSIYNQNNNNNNNNFNNNDLQINNNGNNNILNSNNNNNIIQNKNNNFSQNQQIAYKGQNRIFDKNDQDVDDPDMYDINLPAYNQKFY